MRQVRDRRAAGERPALDGASRDLGYRVGEAARVVGVSAATVRAWEREGLVATRRSPNGYRYFGDEELARLRRVAYLRRVEKLNIAGIRRVLAGDRPPARPAGPPGRAGPAPAPVCGRRAA